MSKTACDAGVLSWDYPEDEVINVDQFVVFVDNTPTAVTPTNQRAIPLSQLNLTPGEHMLVVCAKNAVGLSHPSNQVFLRYVTAVPVNPTNLKIQ